MPPPAPPPPPLATLMTPTITNFKEIREMSALMSRTFFFSKMTPKLMIFDEGVLNLEPFF